MAQADWGGLMASAQGGDAGAYRRLLDALGPWLRGYYVRRLPAALVDDAVQEALIAIHAKRHTYDPARPFGPWLSAVARYKWIDRLRAMKRAPTEALLEDAASIPGHEAAVVSAAVLARLMARLKTAQADAIRLVKLEGYSVEEASERTGQSVSLVKVNIHRGLARMARMAEADEEPPG